jgi:hypothetical protein
MIGTNTALIGLATYFSAVFLIGLAWRKREAAQRIEQDRSISIETKGLAQKPWPLGSAYG